MSNNSKMLDAISEKRKYYNQQGAAKIHGLEQYYEGKQRGLDIAEELLERANDERGEITMASNRPHCEFVNCLYNDAGNCMSPQGEQCPYRDTEDNADKKGAAFDYRDERIAELEKRNTQLEAENQKYRKAVDKIRIILESL